MTETTSERGAWVAYYAPERIAGKPRRLGSINETLKAYRTARVEAVHLVRKFDAYGLQKSILEDLVKRGVQTVILDELRKNGGWYRYEHSIDLWLKGREARLTEKDGVQVFVSLRRLGKGTRISAQETDGMG